MERGTNRFSAPFFFIPPHYATTLITLVSIYRIHTERIPLVQLHPAIGVLQTIQNIKHTLHTALVYRIRTLSIRRNSVQGIENTLHAAIVYDPLALAAADRIDYIEYRISLAVVYAMRTLGHVHYLYDIVYQLPIGLRYWKPSPVLRRSHGCRHDKYYRQQDSPDIYTRSHILYIKSLRNPCGTGS